MKSVCDFTGSIDGCDDDLVGISEGTREFVLEGARARERVWLPDSPEASGRVFCPGGCQSGADFGRVMRIVIYHGYPCGFAEYIETSTGAAEATQRSKGILKWETQLVRYGCC